MKPKKSKKANLEKFRTIFFQVGMILTLSIILVAFEWESEYEYKVFDNGTGGTSIIEEIIPITREVEKTEVKKPPTPIDVLEIIDDDLDIDDVDLSYLDYEIGENDRIEIIEFEDTEAIIEEFVRAEFMPTFQGQEGTYFRNYIASKVKFPVSAIESGVAGTVFASFVIDEKGNVIKTRITRSVHPVIDKAVLDAINKSPRWEPGIQDGRKVRVKYSIAIAFQLQ